MTAIAPDVLTMTDAACPWCEGSGHEDRGSARDGNGGAHQCPCCGGNGRVPTAERAAFLAWLERSGQACGDILPDDHPF